MEKQKKYVVEGACVMCSQGSRETKLIASRNSRIGNNLLMTAKDTTLACFEGTFGNCKRRKGEPCSMSNLPQWFNVADNTNTSDGKPLLKMDSFAVCKTGAGAIMLKESGQVKEPVQKISEEPIKLAVRVAREYIWLVAQKSKFIEENGKDDKTDWGTLINRYNSDTERKAESEKIKTEYKRPAVPKAGEPIDLKAEDAKKCLTILSIL